MKEIYSGIPVAPKPFSYQTFEQALKTRWLARRLAVFASIDSTNGAALKLADEDAVHGMVLLADEQTAGRGRFRRVWQAPAGKALLFTLVMRGQAMAQAQGMLTIAASVAVARCVRRLGADCAIRWPNDVMIGGRKVCGILAERAAWKSAPGWVLGIGLNVNQRQDEFPPELLKTATSLALESGQLFVREAVLALLAGELEAVFDRLSEGEEGRRAIRAEWKAACSTLGRRIAIDTGAEVIEGRAAGLTPSGALVVEQDDGSVREVMAGTVVE